LLTVCRPYQTARNGQGALAEQIEAEKKLAAQIQSRIRTVEVTQNQQSKASLQAKNPLGDMATGNAGSTKTASAA
jgi:hypothetical protein